MANVKTITLGGTEQEVIISGQNCDIRNDGAEIVYASAKPNVTAGKDGVLAIPVGQAAKLLDTRGAVYLLGTGIVQLCGNDYSDLVFKSAPAGGGSGGTQDDVARNMASANAASISALRGDVEDVQTVAENISNPNLLISPDFKINQRGKSGTITDTGYFVDGWQLVSGSVTVNLDGTLTLDGTIKQILENAVDSNTTVSANAGTPSYDNSTKTFTLTAAGEIIKWAKLELGSVATPFTPPDPATELAKCQRYYIPATLHATALTVYANELLFLCPLPVTMRTCPSLTSDATFKMYKTSGNSYTGDEADWAIRVHSGSPKNGVVFALAKEAHGVAVGERYLVITSGGFSAEL